MQEMVDYANNLSGNDSEESRQLHGQQIKLFLNIPDDVTIEDYIKLLIPKRQHPRRMKRRNRYTLMDMILIEAAETIAGNQTLRSHKRRLNDIFLQHTIDIEDPDEREARIKELKSDPKYGYHHPWNGHVFTQQHYVQFLICAECGGLEKTEAKSAVCDCGHHMSKRVWWSPIENWLKTLPDLGLRNTDPEIRTDSILIDILDGLKYRTDIVKSMLSDGLTPYAVHGDGVQAFKRGCFGLFILHATNLLLQPSVRLKRQAVLPYIICEGPKEPPMTGINSLIAAEASYLAKTKLAFLAVTPGDMPAACKMHARKSYNAKDGCPICDYTCPTRNMFEGMKGTNTTYHSDPTAEGNFRHDFDAFEQSEDACLGTTDAKAFWHFNPFAYLWYFSIVAATPADTMHMLHMGICKWIVNVLKTHYLSQQVIDSIEHLLRNLQQRRHDTWMSDRQPYGVFAHTGTVILSSRLRLHIEQKLCTQAKAAQFKNFFMYFFAPTMRTFLPVPIYTAILHFVSALRLCRLTSGTNVPSHCMSWPLHTSRTELFLPHILKRWLISTSLSLRTHTGHCTCQLKLP
eukprot:TRINITY_DN11862_c0_g1_i6.p1 TRINITY_DN11862_c0_g1~~TRINITY_DN11862_c0_g1_i6.p1  ORF type:complete len:572 (+),score=31.17 TRINITY_DN11862_c0_g1_i6:1-1716(+)